MVEKFIVGADVGATWTRVGICTPDLKKENIKKMVTKTPRKKHFRDTTINKFSISNVICEMLSNLLSENNIKPDQIKGMGIATFGPLNIRTGEIINIGTGFRKIPIKNPIKENFPKIPLFIIQDCNAAILGIHFFEAEDDEKDNLFYVTISSGIGGGAICNGRLLLGKDGNAAEVGHNLLDPRTNMARGSWNAKSSGNLIRITAINEITKGQINAEKLLEIVNNDKEKITAKTIFQAARLGDELSKKIVDDCIYYTKIGVGMINNNYDCSSIYFGGGMMHDKDQIIPHIREQFEKNPIEFTINTPPRIKVTTYIDDIGLMGAFVFVKYNLEKNKVIS
ncbi:MAG: ROK family protein [Candidatus Thorarchaeota archaeon]